MPAPEPAVWELPDTPRTLPAAWSRRWAQRPSAPVLRFAGPPADLGEPGGGGGHGWMSAGQLEAASAFAARRLEVAGVRPGERVLWLARAEPAAVAAAVGILRLGAVLVPLDPSCGRGTAAHVVDDVRPAAAVVEGPADLELLSAAEHPPVALDRRLDALSGTEGTPRQPCGAPGRPGTVLDAVAPQDRAVVIYTSGTTGRPKGAVLTHANLSAGTAAVRRAWEWTADDRLALSLPLFHVHGLCIGLFGTLDAGASALVAPRFDAEAVLRSPEDEGTTLLFGVPTMYHRLVARSEAAALGRFRLCVSGSAPLPAALWQEVSRRAGASVLERYGMTETMLTLSNPYRGERRAGTVGRPLPGIEARLGAPQPDGSAELQVRGPSLFAGYWRRPASSAQCWDDGWFRTGDLATVDADGYFSIKGRAGDLIISGGHNVHPSEVEDVLLRHPAVAEVAVVGEPDDEWGEVVVAFVVSVDGRTPGEDLASLAAAELAPHQRPRRVRVVESLPRNAMGKVDRRGLAGGR